MSSESWEVHRYMFDKEDELYEYIKILVNLELLMPLKKRPQLSKHIDTIYEGTAGCVGILKDWLTRSLYLALEEKDSTVTIDHLIATKLQDRQMSRIAREINEGEMQIYMDKKEDIRLMLGMCSSKQDRNKNINQLVKTSRKPGERHAKRDPIGTKVANA